VAPASIEVVLRNGRMLRVGATTDAAAVARLAAALEA
jgi:transposase